MAALHPSHIMLTRFNSLTAFFTAILLAIPGMAWAVDQYPPIICNGLYGCGSPPGDVILQTALPTIGGVLIQIAAGGAVIAIVYAGMQMVIGSSDESKVTNARKAILFALGGLGIALSATSLVSFVATEEYGLTAGATDLGGIMAAAVRILIMFFNLAFGIVIIFAGIRMIASQGAQDEFKKGGNMIKWSVIGAIVVNVSKAIVQALLALNL